jgi:hypothetical protein
VGAPTGEIVVAGTVARLREDSDGERRRVVRFVLSDADGALLAVEMRGEELRGVLNDGDSVAVSRASRALDGVFRPSELWNRTTDSRVEMWSPSLRRRVVRAVGPADIWKAAVAAGVGAVAGLVPALAREESSGPETPGPTPPRLPEEAGPSTVLLVVAAIALPALVAIVLATRRSNRVRAAARRWTPVAVGLALGLAVALILA